MKKALCLLLALSMLTSIPVTALATNQETLAETVSPEIEFDEPAIGAPEEIGYDPTSEEEAPVDSSEDVGYFIPTSEEEAELDDETLARLDRAEIRANAELQAMESSLSVVNPSDSLTTLATTYSVTVKVTFPYAATAAGRVQLRLYSPAETDENGFVTQHPSCYYSTWVSVAKGATSASTVFTVPAGDYFPGVYTTEPYFGLYMRTENVFNADGTPATNTYTATPIKVSGTKTFNITAPQPARVISGTVEFSEPLTESLWFGLDGRSQSRWSSNYFYISYSAAKGATSVPFSIPVPEGTYYLELYGENGWAYYDVYGEMSTSYENRAYLSVLDESLTDLVLDGDFLLVEQEETVSIPYHEVTYTINLPETLSESRQYMILVFRNGELWDYWTQVASKDTTRLTGSFSFQENYSFSLGYVDVTDWGNMQWSNYYPGARYLGENGAVVSNSSDAAVFTMGTSDMTITMNDTSNYKLTGTLSLGSAKTTEVVYFSMVEFDNGEQFGARVCFPAGKTEADYTIYVPKTQSGSFKHWIAAASNGRAVYLDSSTIVEVGTHTLTGNMELDDFAFPATPINVTGTISLPDGMTAPAGGQAMSVSINSAFIGYYHMAEGESSVTLSVAADLFEDNSDNYMAITLLNPSDDLYNNLFYYGTAGGTMTDLDLTLLEAVTLSGTVNVPESAKDKLTTVYIQSYSYPVGVSASNDYCYVSVPAGETSEFYSVKVVKDANLRVQARVYADGNGTVVSGEYQYLQTDGSTSTTHCNTAVLSEDSTANFTFEEGNIISGTISLAEGIPGGPYSFSIDLMPMEGGSRQSTYGSFNGTSGTWQIAVPKNYTGTWRVECVLYYEGSGAVNVLTDTWFYYSEEGGTTNYSEIDLVTAPATDINFIFPAAYIISGTITIPTEFIGYEFGGHVYAFNENSDRYLGYFSSYSTSYELKVPTDYTGKYRLAINTYNYSDSYPIPGLITEMLYLAEDGSLTTDYDSAALFTVGEDGLKVDWTLPVGESCIIKVNAPDGLSGYYEGQFSLIDTESGEWVYSQYFYFNGSSTTVALTIPAELAEADLILGIYLWSGESVVTDSYRYWSENGWVTSQNDADVFPFGDGEASITLPAAKSASLTLTAPAGHEGYYDLRVGLVTDSGYGGWNSVDTERASFTGTETTVDFTLPSDSDSDCYKVRVYLWSGPGCPLDTEYYYAGDNSWTTDYSSAVDVDFSEGSAVLSLPAAQYISGSFISSDGSPVTFAGHGASFYLYTVDGTYISTGYTLVEDGNFTLCVDNNLTGEFYLYARPNMASGINVLRKYYYYKSDAESSVTSYNSSDSAYRFTLDGSGIENLNIYVDTGYVLSGTIELDDEATMSNTSGDSVYGYTYLFLNGSDYYYNISVSMPIDTDQWTYSLVVPKTAATYSLTADPDLRSSTTTNIHTGSMQLGDVDVTDGDVELPTLTLVPAKGFVDITITTPLSNSYSQGTVFVETENAIYNESFYLYSDEPTTTVSLSIPSTDDAETYKVYYEVWNPTGLIRNKNVYVTADGSLTTDSTQAGTFSFADGVEHDITLAEQPPFLTGKIYLPDGLDDEDFSIGLYDNLGISQYVYVNSETILEDGDGNKYVDYKKYANYDCAGNKFYLCYYLSDYSGSLLYNNSNYYGRAYVGENGNFTFYGTNDCHYFEVPASGTATLDFTLLTNENCAADAILQSSHYPYVANGQSYTISYPGATSLTVAFDKRTDIGLTINGTTYGSYDLTNYTLYFNVNDTNGTLTITTGNDGELYESFGFAITSITPCYSDEATQPAVTAVYTSNGSDEATVMADLIAGETVRVSVTGEANSSSILAAAVYDSTGRMIDLIWENLTFDEYGNAVCPLHYENAEGGVTLKVMLLSTSIVPLAQAAELAAAN